jgi:hypothetical protein
MWLFRQNRITGPLRPYAIERIRTAFPQMRAQWYSKVPPEQSVRAFKCLKVTVHFREHAAHLLAATKFCFAPFC